MRARSKPRRKPMQYLLLIYGDEQAMTSLPKEEAARMTAAYMAYAQTLQSAGALQGANRLKRTNTASTVRATGGKTEVLDGPYAETKEQLAGYFLIDVPNLDEALSWAARCPGAAYGAIEVRPVWEM
jgi:hypothetical protein